MSETSVPAASGVSVLCVWQSPRCEQYYSTMSLHQTNGNSEPQRLAIRSYLIEVIVIFTLLLIWISAFFVCTLNAPIGFLYLIVWTFCLITVVLVYRRRYYKKYWCYFVHRGDKTVPHMQHLSAVTQMVTQHLLAKHTSQPLGLKVHSVKNYR